MRALPAALGLTLVLTAAAVASTPAAADEDNPWLDRHDLNIGHRGATFDGPENTLYSLEQGIARGAHMVEFDLFASAEGEIVVIHDATVDRTTDGSGAVGTMTVEELKALDAGYWHVDGSYARTDAAPDAYRYRGIATGDREPPAGFDANDFTVPTLEEVLERFPNTWLLFEIKDFAPTQATPAQAAQRMADLLEEYGRDRTNGIIASFDDRWIEVMQQLSPQMSFAPGLVEAAAIWATFAEGGVPAGVDRYDILFLPDELEGIEPAESEETIANANESGLAVHVFTVNDCHALEAFMDVGVHGLLSDDPQLLEDVYTWRGARDRPAGAITDPCAVAALNRHAGADRIETAARVSQARFRAADTDTIVVARADDYADALAGVPLAHAEGAPMLLTGGGRLAEQVRIEVERLEVTDAIVLGGTAAISDGVVEELEALEVDVERVSGPNRFATAAAIADRLGDWDTAVLVEGANPDPARGWPDAVSAGPFAALHGAPVLLATRDRLPAETAEALEGADEVVVVGGTAAVSDAVVADVDADVRRIAGADRYETSALVAEEVRELDGADPARLWLATGRNWPDALAAGATAAADGAAVLLVDGRDLAGSPPSRDSIGAWSDDLRDVRVAGGTAAVADAVIDQVIALLARANPEAD